MDLQLRRWQDRVITRIDAISELPEGYLFAGVNSGIKRNKRDLALMLCSSEAVSAGVFTQNRLRAPCVARNAELVQRMQAPSRALVVNSGNANAMTGEAGIANNQLLADHAALQFDGQAAQVLTCSTGVIGVELPVSLLTSALPLAHASLRGDLQGVREFAQAILSTDTCIKVAALTMHLPGREQPIQWLGIAKGSGMVHPNMATTLGFVFTDAQIAHAQLQAGLRAAIEPTFNAISVDGDCSTNDCVMAFANGQGASDLSDEEVEQVLRGMHAVLHSLAVQVAQDGEGASRLVEVVVKGAASNRDAKAIARQIAISPLFKCSVFAGSSGGWGRLAAACGHAAMTHDIALSAQQICIRAQGISLVENGQPVAKLERDELEKRLQRTKIRWEVSVGTGPGQFCAYSCDLTYDYVRINADEARQIVADSSGAVSKRLSLAGYTPALKHQLLIDALGYVTRFTGLRVMVRVSGTVLERPQLLAALARDLELVVDAAMRPVVVLENEDDAHRLESCWADSSHRFVMLGKDVRALAKRLDRGQPSLIVAKMTGDELARLCVDLDIDKLIIVGDEGGLFDERGPVSLISTRDAQQQLASGQLRTERTEHFEMAARAIERGVAAIHLVDGRVAHVLVGELFTDEGVGSLISRKTLLC